MHARRVHVVARREQQRLSVLGREQQPFALRRKRALWQQPPNGVPFGTRRTERRIFRFLHRRHASFLHRVAHDDAGRSACVLRRRRTSIDTGRHPSRTTRFLRFRCAPRSTPWRTAPLDRGERVRNVSRTGEAQHAAALVHPHLLSSFEPQRFVLEARRRPGAARFGRRPHRFAQHARTIGRREHERRRERRDEHGCERPRAPAAACADRRPAHSSTPGL